MQRGAYVCVRVRMRARMWAHGHISTQGMPDMRWEWCQDDNTPGSLVASTAPCATTGGVCVHVCKWPSWTTGLFMYGWMDNILVLNVLIYLFVNI